MLDSNAMDENISSKIDLRYLDHKVVFSICDCSLHKNYSFYKLNREEATQFIKRLKRIEQYTWKQFMELSRESGLTPERKNSESYQLIHEQNSYVEKLVAQHYFHFRVEQKDLFRIFGYQREQFFCITHIDPKGKIHH